MTGSERAESHQNRAHRSTGSVTLPWSAVISEKLVGQRKQPRPRNLIRARAQKKCARCPAWPDTNPEPSDSNAFASVRSHRARRPMPRCRQALENMRNVCPARLLTCNGAAKIENLKPARLRWKVRIARGKGAVMSGRFRRVAGMEGHSAGEPERTC